MEQYLCHINADSEEFSNTVWDVYQSLAKEHHATGGFTKGVGFVIQTSSPMLTGAVVLVMCALRKRKCLTGIKIGAVSNGHKVVINAKGKVVLPKS